MELLVGVFFMFSSIQSRLLFALILVGVLTLALSFFNTAKNEKQLAETLVETSLLHSADSYFDSINTLMLSGMMSTRSILQEKLRQREGMVDARIVRSDQLVALYGPGHDDQAPQDDYDRKALAGERVSFIESVNGERVLTILEPLVASADFRGTDCLGCHVAKEGDVLGVVRLSSSLAAVDADIEQSVFVTVLWQCLSIVVAFAVLAWLVHRWIMVRLTGLRRGLLELESSLDLTHRFSTQSNDEIGQVSNALDRMIQGFRENMLGVAQSAESLLNVAQQVSEVANKTEIAVSGQKEETDSVATAVVEMESTAHEVKNRTEEAQHQSSKTEAISSEGIIQADNAREGINNLSENIRGASGAIDRLEHTIQSVTSVLDVITAIAEQTNLLALNAAIEAARAGEQGRGFAVVADEVRSLANRTHESTDEIKKTIDALQAEAKHAVVTMTESTEQAEVRAEDVRMLAEKLAAIAEQVADMNRLNLQIAQAADQQNQTAGEIQRNTTRMRDIADESEQVAEQAKQNSDELVHMAEHLNDRVNKFQL